MHTTSLLHKFLSKSLPEMHSTRLASLMCAVANGLEGNKLTLTALGRSAKGESQVKNKIKQMDRLLGNKKLHSELDHIYSAIAHLVIANKKHPIINVDWASVDNRNKFHVLKATVAYEGRSITIFDQTEYKDRPSSKKNNSLDRFVNSLEKILPIGCKPVIVTDAGFNTKWFMRIESKGWYWVGRLRGMIKIKYSEEETWKSCQNLFKLATKTPKHLGTVHISKARSLECNIFLYKKNKKNRIKKNKDGSREARSLREDYERAAKEPWLLASNLPKSFTRAKKVVNCYKKRMQIEEVFRDTKSLNYGLGVRHTLSQTKERVAVLILISVLILLVLGVLGKAAYENNLYKSFQANTIRHRKVLSLWYLGRQIYEHMLNRISKIQFQCAASNIFNEIQTYETL